MANRKQRERFEHQSRSRKLAQEARRQKYNDVIPLSMSRRSELVIIGRSQGGGAQPSFDGYPAVADLCKQGLVVPHKNLNGYYIATAKGRRMYEALMRAIEADNG